MPVEAVLSRRGRGAPLSLAACVGCCESSPVYAPPPVLCSNSLGAQEEVDLYGEEVSVDATEKDPAELEVSVQCAILVPSFFRRLPVSWLMALPMAGCRFLRPCVRLGVADLL